MSTDHYGDICRNLEANGSDLCRMLQNERGSMNSKHWIWLVVVLAVGYYLGTKYPSLLSGITSAA